VSDETEDIASRTEIVPYPDIDGELPEFDCGKDWFNEFINTDEIDEYHEERFGVTRLVYFEGELAAFFSLSANALRDADYQGSEMDSVDELSSYPYDVPAYLLGHLAVAEECQDRGLGRFLLFRAIARSKQADIPFRVLLLHAQEDVVDFYERHGFVASESTEGYPRLMFVDLADIPDPA